MNEDYRPSTVTFNEGEIAALQDLFTMGGDYPRHVENLRQISRVNNQAGTYGITQQADRELRHLQSAVTAIIRSKRA